MTRRREPQWACRYCDVALGGQSRCSVCGWLQPPAPKPRRCKICDRKICDRKFQPHAEAPRQKICHEHEINRMLRT
jgi:hypothetical protein